MPVTETHSEPPILLLFLHLHGALALHQPQTFIRGEGVGAYNAKTHVTCSPTHLRPSSVTPSPGLLIGLHPHFSSLPPLPPDGHRGSVPLGRPQQELE